MSIVWKYELRPTDEQIIGMPEGAFIIHVDCQGDALCIWAVVDPAAPLVPRRFRIYGTGHPIDSEHVLMHVGSALMHGGVLVWHVFEDKS